ncbi:MAG: EscJ/YscJ/HrcJ family type III secretion inner membrane ring protein, partial [Burkholderiaceae bacterium]|nr:EscJ/YscJ/HrcJ family type III secretion inner membrane ring protein [Burkholderiaceae bacterium]
MRPWAPILCIVLSLAGCKSELYGRLDETEANQMLALLIYNKIAAQKSAGKEGIALQVDED